jgi:hypothetical protein
LLVAEKDDTALGQEGVDEEDDGVGLAKGRMEGGNVGTGEGMRWVDELFDELGNVALRETREKVMIRQRKDRLGLEGKGRSSTYVSNLLIKVVHWDLERELDRLRRLSFLLASLPPMRPDLSERSISGEEVRVSRTLYPAHPGRVGRRRERETAASSVC